MTRAPKLLVVDDGERYVQLFHALMRDYRYATRCELAGPCWQCPHRKGCVLTHAHDWAETEAMVRRHRDLDAVLLDMRFELPASRLVPVQDERLAADLDARQRSEGLRILRRLRALRRDLPVILMTAESDIDLSARAPLDADEYLTFAGEQAFDVRALSLLIERVARTELAEGGAYEWGTSPAMVKLRRDAAALARTSLPVLVLGETGTGKSALARAALHRRSGPFLTVDLSALPENLIAAELFGTSVGAFSGAVSRAGRFEEASGGTLFLDEVGNLPMAAQRMLLLALENRSVTRLGETRPRPVDVKVIAATNADLPAMARDGTFRADLLARLNPAAALRVPPLRERIDDLPALARAFCRRRFESGPDRHLLADYLALSGQETEVAARLELGDGTREPGGVVFAFPAGTRARLAAYPWPGNVRELEFLVASSLLMTLADAAAAAEAGRGGAPERLPVSARLIDQLLDQTPSEGSAASEGQFAFTPAPRPRLRDVAADLERAMLRALFFEEGGDFAAMARRLLEGDPIAAERRLRNRFQQLGLRIRDLRKML